MRDNPWQDLSANTVLFIADADHQVEETLIHDWLNKTRKESNFAGEARVAIVPIAHDSKDIDTTQLINQLDLSDDTLLVPLRVVWKTHFDRLDNNPRLRDLLRGNPRRPTRFQAKRILRKDPSRAMCLAGKPATLGDLKQRFEEQASRTKIDANLAEYIASRAGLTLDVAERRLRGGRYKVPRQVARQIRASERYRQGLLEISAQTGESETELRERALPIFNELISVPHNFWQDVMASFNRRIMGMGYEDDLVVDQERLLRFRQIVREHPTALLWTHKTHMDGVAMQAMLFENDFPTPHIVGGINMAFAGVGFLAKRAGAIFIRRSFQDDLLYKLILRNYLGYLMEKHFPLTWSFEGTRSRVGKLMPPRYGILKYVMDAIADSSADKLHIIPVAINYDMINDVKDYAAEQGGAIKRPESLSWFISYLRRLRRPLGRIYIDFGEPVVVDREQISDDKLALAKTAFKVGVEANRVTPVTLTSLMAMALLGSAPRAQTIEELRSGMEELRDWAEFRGIRFTSDFEDKNIEHMREIIDAMVNSELINRYDQGPETVYAVAEEQQTQASYYRNTIVHHFVTKAIAELALLQAANSPNNPLTEFWHEANRLRDLFKFEFFYSPTEEFNQELEAELDYFDKDWQKKLKVDATWANTFLARMRPLVAHAVLRPYIEAYRVMAEVFARLDVDQTMERKAAVSAAFKYARQAYLQRRINSRASIGDMLFKNGYKLLDSYGLVEAGDTEQLEKRRHVSKSFRVLAHRLEHIRALALPNDLD